MFPDGTKFYPDIKNGKYGFNTDPNRGADTFSPFKIPDIIDIPTTTINGNKFSHNVGMGYSTVYFVTYNVTRKTSGDSFPLNINGPVNYDPNTGIAQITAWVTVSNISGIFICY